MGCLTSATVLLQVLVVAVAVAVAVASDEPPVAALHTCNVSHIAEIIASNRLLPLPLQVATSLTKL